MGDRILHCTDATQLRNEMTKTEIIDSKVFGLLLAVLN